MSDIVKQAAKEMQASKPEARKALAEHLVTRAKSYEAEASIFRTSANECDYIAKGLRTIASEAQ